VIVTSKTGRDSPQTVLSRAGNDWRTCASDLVRWLVNNNRCFSSGEVASYIRLYRPDVVFSVTALGDTMRDWYYSREMPSYELGYPSIISRTTTGRHSTPAGAQVFVYAPSTTEGLAHDFEVDVPLPATVAPKRTVAEATARVKARQSTEDLLATVRADRRCVIPRVAVEALIHKSGRRFNVESDPMFLHFTGDEVSLSLDHQPGAQPYFLWAGGGRVSFAAPKGTEPYVPGQYPIRFEANMLVVEL